MASKKEQILAAMITALQGTDGVGNRIYRSRVEPLARNESPALIVEPVSISNQQNTSLPTLDSTLRVRAAIIIRALIPDQASDDTMVSLHSKLMADLTLGGLAIDIRPAEVTFTFAEADQPAGVISCEYDVLYRTQIADITQ
mgnify:CR=1 FL=1